MRVRFLLLLLLFALLSSGPLRVLAQQGGTDAPPSTPARSSADEERKRQFLRAREEMHTVPATPAPVATPVPRPKPRPRTGPDAATPSPAVTPRPAPPRPPPEVSPHPRLKPDVTPPTRSFSVTPYARPATMTPLPAVTPAPAPAPVTIQKSGFEDQQGLEPAPSNGGGWFTKWKYLTSGIRDAIDRAPVQKRRWRYIVVHNSGTRQGNAKAFDYYHLRIRKMKNGLAYHFVIGNGTSSGDGQVEIGNRWTKQINGGHVHSDYLNNIALGICLVGDFNRDTPTARQLATLDELIRYLRSRVGKIDRQDAIVKAHKEINPPRWPTDCPGDHFPYAWLHKNFDH